MSQFNLKVGDKVYSAYDGKAERGTVCIVTEIINDTTVKIKGNFWG